MQNAQHAQKLQQATPALAQRQRRAHLKHSLVSSAPYTERFTQRSQSKLDWLDPGQRVTACQHHNDRRTRPLQPEGTNGTAERVTWSLLALRGCICSLRPHLLVTDGPCMGALWRRSTHGPSSQPARARTTSPRRGPNGARRRCADVQQRCCRACYGCLAILHHAARAQLHFAVLHACVLPNRCVRCVALPAKSEVRASSRGLEGSARAQNHPPVRFRAHP